MAAQLTHRLASRDDIPVITRIMERAIAELQRPFLSPEQIAASHLSMGLDTQLIDDGTYFLIEREGTAAGCGGWSRRATLYGGNHAVGLRDDRLLDPKADAARIRAMYTDPDFARLGVGRLILGLCEAAARKAGFQRLEMMATRSGQPLYAACGYHVIKQVDRMADSGVSVPGAVMGKAL